MPHLIETLATMGEDALGNHFQIVIPEFSLVGIVGNTISMRVLSVDLPSYEIETYPITKRGRTFNRPSGKTSYTPEISFTFRADKYWDCYNSLMTWMQYIQNNETMGMAGDSGPMGGGGPSTFRHDVEVWAITNLSEESAIPNNKWKGIGAFPKSLDAIAFSEDSGEPIEVSCTLDCMNVIFPHYTTDIAI